ncbi:CBM1 domain-containing protein [Mycena sanguinolenta]|uniref:CBM1 domain-containing protein n=1 Tax=Mycena sanguinolenta TaxID=230812 RepID=A0A8H6WR81_9AGAR|nr:CBM1 domain-containing protein [Mycena sanguinolenta]
MASLLSLLTIALSTSYAAAQTTVPLYGQCGGLGYTGSTVCVSGSFCNWDSDYFSQCIPGTAPPPYSGPINYWFPFGDSYTSTSFDPTSTLPNIHDPFGNPPFPGFTGGGGENYVGFDTETYNSSVIFTYNYAYGGATINASLVTPYEPTVLSLIDQVNEFLTGGVASKPATTPWTSANALFSVWIGVNDLAGSYGEPGDRGAFADTLLSEYFALMQKLVRFSSELLMFCRSDIHSSAVVRPSFCPDKHVLDENSAVGARNFLFLNVPRVDLTPLMVSEGATAQAQLAAVITDFNTRLASRVSSFKGNNTGVSTWLWDSNSVFTTILSNLKAYGFVDAVSYGNTGDFWGNNFHPGQAAHQIFAKDISTLMAGSLWF